MSFKSPKEMMQALIDGKKIRVKTWPDNEFIHLSNGYFYSNEGSQFVPSLDFFNKYEIYEEPKKTRKVTLTRYLIEEQGHLWISMWGSIDNLMVPPNAKILKTETKEIEIEE